MEFPYNICKKKSYESSVRNKITICVKEMKWFFSPKVKGTWLNTYAEILQRTLSISMDFQTSLGNKNNELEINEEKKGRELILFIYFITLEIFYNINYNYNINYLIKMNGPPLFWRGGMVILEK